PTPPGPAPGRASAGAAARTRVRTPCSPPALALGLAGPGLAAAGRPSPRPARPGGRGSALLLSAAARPAARPGRGTFGHLLRRLLLRRRAHAGRPGGPTLDRLRARLSLAGRRADLELAAHAAHAIHVPGVVHRVAHLVVAGQLAAQRDHAVLDRHLDPVRVHPRIVE